MPVITSIKPQKRNKERRNIFLDDRFAFSLPAETLVKAGLHENQKIPPEKVAELIKEGEFSLIFDKVLNFLSFRSRSEYEINYYMLRREVGENTRKMVMEKLKRLMLVNDEDFARQWVQSRSAGRVAGKALIKAELRKKGIAKELIDRLLSEERGASFEQSVAEKLAKDRLERLKNLPILEKKSKLYGFLSRKGFSSEVAIEVIDKLLKKE